MKTITKSSLALLLLTACATTPLSTKLASKSAAERNEYLLEACETDSYHYQSHSQDKRHAQSMINICQRFAKPDANKVELLKQCKAEAVKGEYRNEVLTAEHTKKLTEICEAFAQ